MCCALLAAALAGCDSTGGNAPGGTGEAEGRGASRSAIGSMIAASNGLELRKWVVRDEPGVIAAALREFGESTWVDPLASSDDFTGSFRSTTDDGSTSGEALSFDSFRPEVPVARLRRNGLLLTRVPEDRLDALLERMGGSLTDLRVWHGQAPDWRETARRGIRGTSAIIVDGRARVFRDGALRGLLRSWTLPMEDTALLQIEFAVQFEPIQRASLLPGEVDESERGELIAAGSFEVQAAAGEVWILTCSTLFDSAGPNDAGRESGRGTGPSDLPSGPGDIATTTPALEGSRFGPSTLLPPTLGEYLFRSELPPTRTLLVFVARIPTVAAPLTTPEATPLDAPELDPQSAVEGEPEMGDENSASPEETTPADPASDDPASADPEGDAP